MTDTDAFDLKIRTGAHAGARKSLPDGTYVVGSSFEADLALIGEGLAPLHARISLGGGQIRIEALADSVTIGGHPNEEGPSAANGPSGELPKGQAVLLPLPLTVRLNDTELSWAVAGRPASPGPVSAAAIERGPGHGSSRLLAPGAVAAVALVIVAGLAFNPVVASVPPLDRPEAELIVASAPNQVVANAGPGAPVSGTPHQQPRDTSTTSLPASIAPLTAGGQGAPSAGTGPAAAGAHDPSKDGSDAAAASSKDTSKDGSKGSAQRFRAPSQVAMNTASSELRNEIAKAGLLNVHVAPAGTVVNAQGSVEPGAVARWQTLQRWFDERFKGEVTLVNGVDIKAEKVPSALGVEAVWRGAEPHLVIRGQKYLQGAVLEDGWTIQTIEANRVLLKREDRLVAVTF